jgi:hypothetical protein
MLEEELRRNGAWRNNFPDLATALPYHFGQ